MISSSRTMFFCIGVAAAIAGLAYVGCKNLGPTLFSVEEPKGAPSLSDRVTPKMPSAEEVDMKIQVSQDFTREPSSPPREGASPGFLQEIFLEKVVEASSDRNLSSISTISGEPFSSESDLTQLESASLPELEMGPKECCDALDVQYAQLQSEVNELNAKRAEASPQLAELDAEYRSLEQELVELRAKISDMDQIIQEVHRSLQTLRAALKKEEAPIFEEDEGSGLIDAIEEAFFQKIVELREKEQEVSFEQAIEGAERRLFLSHETKCKLEVNLEEKHSLLRELKECLSLLKAQVQGGLLKGL